MSWYAYYPICKSEEVFDREKEICTSCLVYKSQELWERSCINDKLDILCICLGVERRYETYNTLEALFLRIQTNYSPRYKPSLEYCPVCTKDTPHCPVFGYCETCSNRKELQEFKGLPTYNKMELLWQRASNSALIDKIDVYKFNEKDQPDEILQRYQKRTAEGNE